MKLTLICLVLISISCSSHKKNIESLNNPESSSSWRSASKKLLKDKEKIDDVLLWYSEYLEKHNKTLLKYEVSIKALEKNVNRYANSNEVLKLKKSKLQLSLKKDEISNKHIHFLEDHEIFMNSLTKVIEVKNEIESHDGHDH